MFYEESQINSLLICPVCESRLEDPRMLSHAALICRKCVDISTEAESSTFACKNCSGTHEIPLNGFPINKKIAKL